MLAKIQKWGNSLALRIPKMIAIEANLAEESQVEIHIVDGKIVVSPLLHPQYKLEDLLAGITVENLHSEMDTGKAVGNEVW